MSYRSPARWLAPIAILAALAAIFAIYNATFGSEDGEDSAQTTSSEERREGSSRRRDRERREGTSTNRDTTSTTPRTGRKTYTVESGDTLASIAEETGVPIEELQELNPGVDSNSLSIGQEIRLAR
jgi:LysM repeat protein